MHYLTNRSGNKKDVEPTDESDSESEASVDPNMSEIMININELGIKSGQNSFENDQIVENTEETLLDLGTKMTVLQAQDTKDSGGDIKAEEKAADDKIAEDVLLDGFNYVPGKNDFIMRVFLIVGIMLTIIFLLLLIMLLTSMKLVLNSIVTTFILFLIGGCCAKDLICAVLFWMRARKSPYIVFCIILSVLFYTLLIAAFGVYFQAAVVLGSVFTLIIVALAAMALAFLKQDFTKLYIVVGIGLLAFIIIFIIVAATTKFSKPEKDIIIPIILTVLQAVVFILEIQIIIDGRTIEVGQDERYLGAFLVCNSILEIKYNLIFRLFNSRLGF